MGGARTGDAESFVGIAMTVIAVTFYLLARRSGSGIYGQA